MDVLAECRRMNKKVRHLGVISHINMIFVVSAKPCGFTSPHLLVIFTVVRYNSRDQQRHYPRAQVRLLALRPPTAPNS